MATYYKPVLNYDLSFDCDKGEKNKMDVYSTRTVGTGRNRQVKFVKKTAEVRVCESTNVDETIWTVNKFKRELEISGMAWADARYNFTNCLGEIAQLRLEEVQNKHMADNGGADYPATKDGFKLMIKEYIRELCKDEDAKGTLKRAVFNGHWQKPVNKDITNHNMHVQRLLKWVDLIPGYQNDDLAVREKHRMYLSTFPKFWTESFDSSKNIDDTIYEEIDCFMEKHKEKADKEHAKKEKEKK